MWLNPKLISEYTPTSNFSANHEDNENDQDNENHLDNENEGNYPANKYIFKVRSRKKGLVYLCLLLNIFHALYKCFSVGSEHLLFDRVVFFHCKYQLFMFYVSWKSSYFSSKFFKECLLFTKIHLIDLKLSRLFSRGLIDILYWFKWH